MNSNINEIYERIENIRNGLNDETISIDMRPKLRKELESLERQYSVQLYNYEKSLSCNVDLSSKDDAVDIATTSKVYRQFSQ